MSIIQLSNFMDGWMDVKMLMDDVMDGQTGG